MTSSSPLKGFELIDCASANGNQGITVAAQLCGYGDNLTWFELELKKAGDEIGIEVQGFDDLVKILRKKAPEQGIEIAPDTPTRL
ncbi:MAG: hypothetical protein WCA07_17495 [Gloeobacterales cyanobacterium]